MPELQALGPLRNLTTGGRISMLIVLFAAMLMTASGIAFLAGMPADMESTDVSLTSLRIGQIASQIIGFIIPSFLMLYLVYGNIFRSSSLNIAPDSMSFNATIFSMIAILPLIGILTVANKYIIDHWFSQEISEFFREVESRPEKVTEIFLKMDSVADLIFNLIMVGFLAAFCEELFFRGTMQRFLYRSMGIHGAILLTALLFSLFHFQFYGLIPRFGLGVLLGYLFAWSGSLYIPVAAHFVFNGFQVVLSYLQQKGILPESATSEESLSDSLLVVLMSLVIVSGLTYLVWKRRKPIIKEV